MVTIWIYIASINDGGLESHHGQANLRFSYLASGAIGIKIQLTSQLFAIHPDSDRTIIHQLTYLVYLNGRGESLS